MELSSVDGRGWYGGWGAELQRSAISLPSTSTTDFFSHTNLLLADPDVFLPYLPNFFQREANSPLLHKTHSAISLSQRFQTTCLLTNSRIRHFFKNKLPRKATQEVMCS